MSDTSEPRYHVGDMVGLRADKSRQGLVMQVLPPAGGEPRYRVFHSAAEVREYYEAQLIPTAELSTAEVSIAETLSGVDGVTLDAANFRARLTAARLSHPQIDHLYALHAARIQFVPFQLKPLLRFLYADQPRLLIADEVGVGKTIEAGLILREMQSRQQVGNVLIVCPKALVAKWRAEMLRFDEQFEPLDGASLRYCLREAHLDGVWPQRFSRAIAPLELLRNENHLVGNSGRGESPGLVVLDPPPSFSLVIVDEAHHLRNPETRSHELARFLCDTAEAVLFLSATPVHLGSENLFTLLNLLRPDLFMDRETFDLVVEPNQHINSAMRNVRHPEFESQRQLQEDAARALVEAGTTTWGSQTFATDPRYMSWLQRLNSGDNMSDMERIRCLRDLEELHTLAGVMNRTRRRDIGRFTIREPYTVSVPFTEDQKAFYDALIEMRREMLLIEHDPFVVRLIIDTLERQASSCLPALIPLLERFLRTGRFFAADVTDADEIQEENDRNLPQYITEHARELRKLAGSLPPYDPKLERLLEIATSTLNESGPGKMLLFSYFLHTLDYLFDHLSAAGFRAAAITGKIPDEEREAIRERFRLPRTDPNAIDVLLSSEVGCEGLDYEFCDRLINYDIPWNPMRIEQRIGRIDRFGQQNDKVLIYNFITPGTVEERIFFRCFERIGIFRDTVGDLEDILSETVQDLTRASLNPTLTAEQLDLLARQKTDNIIRLAEEQRRLEEQDSALLGLEWTFTEEVDDLIADSRFVSIPDLLQMIELYLARSDLNGRLVPDSQDERLLRLRLSRNARVLVADELRALEVELRDRASLGFQRWLDGDEAHLSLTFDQECALERRNLAFVTPIHPLARLAAKHWLELDAPLLVRLSIEDDDIAEGSYLFACDLWESIALHTEVRIVVHAWHIEQAIVDSGIATNLIPLLSRASTLESDRSIAPVTLEDSLRALDEVAHSRLTQALDELRERNEHTISRRLASLNSYYTSRLGRIQSDLARTADLRIQRMRQSEHDRVEREYLTRQQEVNTRRDADIISQRLATGVLTVLPTGRANDAV